MHVQVCPVASQSVLAWVTYSRDALARAAEPDPGGPLIESEVAARLTTFLDEWERQAGEGAVTSVSFDVPLDDAEYLVHAFLRVAERAARDADERGFDISPPEGDEFYAALVDAVIVAMEYAEDPSGAEYGATLRTIWPRMDRRGAPPGDDG